MQIHFWRANRSQISSSACWPVSCSHKRRNFSMKNTPAQGGDLRYSNHTLSWSNSLRLPMRILGWMCLPVLLLGIWGRPAAVGALLAPPHANVSSSSAGEQPELLAKRSVAPASLLQRRVQSLRVSLLRNRHIPFHLQRSDDGDGGVFARHQHRRFGIEADSLRGDVLPFTVARRLSLHERLPAATVFVLLQRGPPVLFTL